jgi:hypothetical protein
VEFETLLMVLLGRANVTQISDENAEDQTEAVTVVAEMMTVVDENGARRTRRNTVRAGAAADHPVVAAAAVDHQMEDQETMVETMEFRTLMTNDSPCRPLDVNLVPLTPRVQTDAAAKAKSSLCYHLYPSRRENLTIISSRSRIS